MFLDIQCDIVAGKWKYCIERGKKLICTMYSVQCTMYGAHEQTLDCENKRNETEYPWKLTK